MKFIRNLNSNCGQTLVEFVFILPIFFLIFFVLVQFANILDGRQKSRMAFWCGLRTPCIPKQKYYGVSVLEPKYSTSEIEGWIHNDVFSKNDVVDIKIKRGSSPVFLNSLNMELAAYIPYLYQNSNWGALKDIFSARVVEKNNRYYFVLKYKGKSLCYAPAL